MLCKKYFKFFAMETSKSGHKLVFVFMKNVGNCRSCLFSLMNEKLRKKKCCSKTCYSLYVYANLDLVLWFIGYLCKIDNLQNNKNTGISGISNKGKSLRFYFLRRQKHFEEKKLINTCVCSLCDWFFFNQSK